MLRQFILCLLFMGSLTPAFALPVAPLVREVPSFMETTAARMSIRAPRMRTAGMKASGTGVTMRRQATRPISVTKVSVMIIRKERKSRKQPYAIPDIPKQK